MTDSVIDGNIATDVGGGSYTLGTLNLTGTTVSNNTTGDAGGGIRISSSGVVDVTNSTINDNKANGVSGDGGGISNIGTLTVTNTTFTSNMATDKG